MSGKLKIDNHFQDIAVVKKDGNLNLGYSCRCANHRKLCFYEVLLFLRMESAENMKVQGRKSGGHLKRNSLHEETFG